LFQFRRSVSEIGASRRLSRQYRPDRTDYDERLYAEAETMAEMEKSAPIANIA
jgi:hypothetical protein